MRIREYEWDGVNIALSKCAPTRSASSIAQSAALKPKASLTQAMPEIDSVSAIQGRTRFLSLLAFGLRISTGSIVLPRFNLDFAASACYRKCPNLFILWTGRPDSNRRRPAWDAGILALNYFASKQCFTTSLYHRQTRASGQFVCPWHRMEHSPKRS